MLILFLSDTMQAAYTPANIVPTIMLFVVLLYWTSVILGLVNLDFLDFDIDLDADGDAGTVGWLNEMLAFFNLAYVPFMVFLSFLILPLWSICMVGNHYFGIVHFLPGLLVMAPAFILSLFIAKAATTPFVYIFRKLNAAEEGVQPIGKVCTITIPTGANRIGQARVQIDGSPLVLNVMTSDGAIIHKGGSALVLTFSEKDRVYIIEHFTL